MIINLYSLSLLRDDDNSIFFQVEAYDGGFPDPRTARTNVTVYLTNENDEAPLIIVDTPTDTPTIPENSEPFVQFANLTSLTFDPDPDQGGVFNFTLIEVYHDDDYNDDDDNITSSFSLSPDGILTANRVFDREARPEGFILSILTTDFGYPTQSIINNVTVAIGDKNDQSPYFEGEPPLVTAYELIPPGEVVLNNHTAIDDDIGINAVLRYGIYKGDERDEFTIDPVTGTISVAKVLNRMIQEEYNLTIIAMDEGQPVPLYGFGTVLISVIDSNDNAPVFHEPLTAFFPENSPTGFIFYTINATDSDEGTNSFLSFYFAPNTTDSFTDFDNVTNVTTVRFDLNSSTGDISVQDHFDREIESDFELTIMAVDAGLVPGGLTSTALVTVLVQDLNDNTPYFINSSYSFEVLENSPLDTELGQVFANDDDATEPNNQLRYSLIGDRSSELSVDPETGLVTVNDTIDWETGPNYTVSLLVVDQGSPPLQSVVPLTVFITDVNDREPEWVESSLNISVLENSAPGSSVGFIEAIDPDSPGNNSLVTYSLLLDYSDHHFSLNSSTGQIMTLATFNREERDLYDLVVMATDSGDPQLSSTATVYIEITDSNDHDPVFSLDQYNADISESVSISTPVIQVMASDDDIGINADLTYAIIDSTQFSINPSTGSINTAVTFDFESVSHYTFTVLVTDSGLPLREATSTVTVNIIDYNDNPPLFTQSIYSLSLFENIPIGSNLLQVNATDDDTGDNAMIEFLLIDGPSHVFGISNETGVLYTHGFVNREELGAEFNLTILANNSLSPVYSSSTSVINIFINDFNDQAPSFNSTILRYIPEDTPPGSTVYTLVPSDGDAGDNGTISYSLVDGNDAFQLNESTGEIILLSYIDYEGPLRFYYMTVNASDNGNPSLYNFTTLILQVTDTNDNPPSFTASNYILSVSNTAPTNTLLMTVGATDTDTTDPVHYYLMDSTYSSLFSVSRTTGSLNLLGSLLTYPDQVLNITLEATDGVYNSTAIVSVHVTGPGSSPVFTSTSYSVSITEAHDSTIPVLGLYDRVAPTSPSNAFSIVYGNHDNAFSISSTSLYVDSSKLDFESISSYQISIRVIESGSYAYSVVNVSISDVNEFPPIFSLSSFYVPLYETTAAAQSFFKLQTSDGDRSAPANVIRYSITSGNINNIFTINQFTGDLSLNRLLDYNVDPHNYTINITAANTETVPPLSSTVSLSVQLFNGNRHTPVFSPVLYSTSLTESSSIGNYIGITVRATDGDTGSDGEIRFGLLGDHRNYDFEINSTSGNISISGEGLDYERQGAYQLRAIVSDGGVPQLYSTALIVIVIIDENDNEPIWDMNTYLLSISENTSIGSDLLTVHASDADPVIFNELTDSYDNTNGLITYSIFSGDSYTQFTITPQSGILRLVSSLNRENVTNYTLTINATDGGGHYANALCVVTVTDVNDVTPYFSSSLLTASVPENSPNETFIIKLLAKDEDITNGPAITYSIAAGNDYNIFYINTSSGEIFTNGDIDREDIDLFNLTVSASDNSANPLIGSATLLIRVLDINEVPPYFDQNNYSLSVSEDQALGQVLINITATDFDFGENSTIQYYIVSGDISNSFRIDPNTGGLTLIRDIDYEYIDYYELVIGASDSGHISIRLTNETTLSISVIDVNDNTPIFEQDQYIANISEAADPETELIDVLAFDFDSGSNSELIYSFINTVDGDSSPISDNGIFMINDTTGLISLALSLDRETQSNYTLPLVVKDNGSPSLSSTSILTVIVDDYNDNPPIFNTDLYQGSVLENSPLNTPILTVSAVDSDINSNADISYDIEMILMNETDCTSHCPNSTHLCSISYTDTDLNTDQVDLNDTFTINSVTGGISTAGILDREYIDYYVLLVHAYDGGSPVLSSSTCVFINITDTNDQSPVFNQSLYTGLLVENAPPGTVILRVQASDDDIGINSDIAYSLATGSDHFTVHPLTGVIMNLSPVDREETTQYNFTVTATDSGVPSNVAMATVTVEIIDVNDSPPQFDFVNFTGSISENADPNTDIIRLTASDLDIGINADLSYDIISVNPPGNSFTINSSTGLIASLVPLDRESIDYYTLLVIVTDSGAPPLNDTTIVEVIVLDQNDNPPIFDIDSDSDSYNATLTENIDYIDHHFMMVAATDADIGNNAIVYYNISSINATSTEYGGDAVFYINSTTGELSITGALDSESTDRIILTIQAYNSITTGQFQYSTILLIISVNDVNDNPPLFDQNQYVTGIYESAIIGSDVISVNAADSDIMQINSDIIYLLISPDSYPFSINNESGLITTSGPLDSETIDQYTLTVVAMDTGEPPLSSTVNVSILILNTNDNRPIFSQTHYDFNILENQPIGSNIGLITATDVDLDNITYQLGPDDEGESVDDIFNINATTGVLTTLALLDREEYEGYSFIVKAIDDPLVGLSSEVNVSVSVLDLNDNPPLFDQNIYTVSWNEDTDADTELIQLNATDSDIGLNGDFNFYIVHSTADNSLIGINDISGSVLLTDQFDRESVDNINITVSVVDNGMPPLSSTALLIIHVLDVNDNGPLFTQSVYSTVISEDISVNSTILMLSATDADINANGQFSFSILNESDFAVDPSSGVMSVARQLDYERTQDYSFQVLVSDHGNPPLSSTAQVVINITDINDNSPYFEQDIYYISVSESSILYSSVFTVPGQDPDNGTNGELRYTILSGNEGFHFNLNEKTGLLSTTAQYLDREITDHYVLSIRAVDQGSPQFTASTTLDISISDINDHHPEFSSQYLLVSISESSPEGTVVTRLTASDDDIGTNSLLTYRLIDDDSDDNSTDPLFLINSTNGEVILNGFIDTEIQPVYSLSVLVADSGEPPLSDSMILTINVMNDNEYNPYYILNQYYLNISIETAIGASIGYLIASDADHNDEISLMYSLINTDTDTLAINSNTGELYVIKSLIVGSYSLSLQATDPAGATGIIMVHVNVHDRNNTGSLFESVTYHFTVSEDSHINSFIGSVRVNSDLTNSLMRFILPNGTRSTIFDDTFELKSNGSLILIGNIDYERLSRYVLNIESESVSTGDKVYMILTISIIDVNDNSPYFSTDQYHLLVSESTPVGTDLITLSTYDLDSLGVNTQTLIKLSQDSDLFSFNPLTQTLTLAQPLDRERDSSHLLIINASNPNANEVLYTTGLINITVLDANDNNPSFSQLYYSIEIPSSTSIGSEVLHISVTDQDIANNGELVYFITHQTVPGLFAIDINNGSIYTNDELMIGDEEEMDYTLSLLVTDRGYPTPRSSTSNVFINIYKDNLNSPVFDEPNGYTVQAIETLAIGSSVLVILATDPDQNQTNAVRYSINTDQNDFNISPLTGSITVASTLDFNTLSFYSLSISATDQGRPPKSSSVLVNISIIDINNHNPDFNQSLYTASITEGLALGSAVIQISASDIDSAGLRYQITVNKYVNDTALYSINETTGLISTASDIDFELTPFTEILVSAIDSGYNVVRSNSVPVQISVRNINDEYPVFDQSEYYVDVIRLLTRNQLVLDINATDPDMIPDTVLIYNISYQSDFKLYSIDNATGVISTLIDIPENSTNSSYIIVTVSDGSLVSMVTVHISIIDEGNYCESGNTYACTYVV